MEKEEIFLGHFARPFGIKGELKLIPTHDFWEGVLQSKKLFLRLLHGTGVDARPLEVVRFRRQKSHYILKVADVSDRTDAEALVGGEIFIDSEELDVGLPDRPLPFQIVGNTVMGEDGTRFGEVTSVMFTPVHDVYEVAGEKGTFLVPAVPEFVISTDVKKGEIVIRPIPGLIED
ncbi:MAG: 16S rRNA processing protein RimM [Candidatus Latescibacteria bacterium]|nr:16S rRNA processing protein RimM [Candidatus Latescibacterota bacterium]NIM66495.1 16S rRNA processing protein RimM [Candidatus Latescibacterota bacterium]NIO02975.1 16S rRNA processing protein RimM [Candidatus Latescibacterota bacterium]NIO30110.1 16S rRNA processing protein RimM [Candidatus Latescibacterota bacterium]NIO57729.1 16S rRNA processing protein RimM [Candidatus Latescibacterota bacterium]